MVRTGLPKTYDYPENAPKNLSPLSFEFELNLTGRSFFFLIGSHFINELTLHMRKNTIAFSLCLLDS